ncbi:MAG: hypothetical protein ACJ754_00100 [Pyrinomonadaceae bacterium]
MVTTPAADAFTFKFQSLEGESGNVDLVRGVGNEHPDMVARYNDLLLPVGATGMIEVTPESFGPLRVDKDGDGTFEAEVKPTAYAAGEAADDTYGPTLCFGESSRGGKTLVTITAVDRSGVKAVYYSLDPPPATDEPLPFGATVKRHYRLYTGPFEVDAAQTPVVSAVADDNQGNRAAGYEHRIVAPE